jgi:hypothetical protein
MKLIELKCVYPDSRQITRVTGSDKQYWSDKIK